jgi:two-component system, chemotaxis family, protein-glutamate methylesterase/glutaminase
MEKIMPEPAKKNIIVVGASAGGVEALSAFVRQLPAGFDAAVFVVLHIPAHTPTRLDKILGRETRLKVSIATDGQAIEMGNIYVAPTDRHLMLSQGLIRITRGPREGRVRPSIDVLFRSASVAFGSRVVGVLLSGMLDDGTAGLWAIKDRQGTALVQSPEEAMFASMPESAIRHVKVDLVAPLDLLVKRLVVIALEPAGDRGSSAFLNPHTVENDIAMEGNGLKLGVMGLGKVSKYTCPDCHGVLVEIEEGPIVRFRCHTGHAFSLKALLAEVNESIDKGLWDTLRAIEERVMLLRQMQDLARGAGQHEDAEHCALQANEAEMRLKPLRALVLDGQLFGHYPGK